MVLPADEGPSHQVRPGITLVNSGFSDTSATTLIGDEDENGVGTERKAAQPKTNETEVKEHELDKGSILGVSSKLRLWGLIRSGLRLSFHPVALYKMCCHLWHILQDYWWLWELATMSVSFASMAAVVVTLAVEDGKSLDDWSLPVQPNSLISIFITLSKSAMMTCITGAIAQSMWVQFEQRTTPLMRVEEIQEAGRGPWGSIKLLTATVKGKRFNLIAVIGAVITVATLALDPFVQQVMSFPSRTVPAPRRKGHFPTWRDLDITSVQGAMLGGIYRNPQITNYTCTESSCSWPTITTLGVCSTCKDLTSQADVQCSTNPGPMTPTKSDAWSFETTSCNYTVGGNMTIPVHMQTMSFPGAADGEPGEHSSQWTKIKLLPQQGYQNYSAKNTLGKMISPDTNYWFTTVLSYSTFFDSRTHPLPKVTPGLLAPQIMGCGLHPCGQVWSEPSVVNGTMAHGGVPTSSAPLRLQFNDAGLDRFFVTPNRSDYSDVLQVVNNKEGGGDSFPGNGTFTVSRTVANNLTDLMTQMYRATSLAGNENFGDAFPEVAEGMYGLTDALFDVNVEDKAATAAAGIVGGGGVAARSPVASFARAARGLSEYVRNNHNLDSTDGGYAEEEREDWKGKAWRQETYIEVRWAFLTLPLVVLVATLALLCAAVWRSWDKGARVWKSSSLALLFHDVYVEMAAAAAVVEADGLRDQNGKLKRQQGGKETGARRWRFEADSVKGMNEMAEEMKARLVADDDRLRFVVVE
ncbi:hypothetical protein PG991_000142 [Apiospora marii]|uniref:Carboxylic ester hydrolase n=1 Tax=Apiospora marii TaxID=335849 RepID=A0ABR1T371_9PEZI